MAGKVKVADSDHGGEFTEQGFRGHRTHQTTVQRLMLHDTLGNNGVMECVHRTILNIFRLPMASSRLPRTVCGKLLQYTVWFSNHTAHTGIDFETPYEMHFVRGQTCPV